MNVTYEAVLNGNTSSRRILFRVHTEWYDPGWLKVSLHKRETYADEPQPSRVTELHAMNLRPAEALELVEWLEDSLEREDPAPWESEGGEASLGVELEERVLPTEAVPTTQVRFRMRLRDVDRLETGLSCAGSSVTAFREDLRRIARVLRVEHPGE